MWYSILVQIITKRLFKKDPIAACIFVDELLQWVKTNIYIHQPIEPLALFGFIIDLYQFGIDNERNKISLKQFAEYCIGLMIMHCKNTEDLNVLITDFYSLIYNERILLAMDIMPELNHLYDEYVKGNLKSSKFKPDPESDQDLSIMNLSQIVVLDVLKRIEKEVWAQKKFTVRVELSQFIRVLKAFWFYEEMHLICVDLAGYLESYKNTNPEFDQFISQIEGYCEHFRVLEERNCEETSNLCSIFSFFSIAKLLYFIDGDAPRSTNHWF